MFGKGVGEVGTPGEREIGETVDDAVRGGHITPQGQLCRAGEGGVAYAVELGGGETGEHTDGRGAGGVKVHPEAAG